MFDWPWDARLSYGTPEYAAALPTMDCDISSGGVLTPTLDPTLAREEDVGFEAGQLASEAESKEPTRDTRVPAGGLEKD